MAPHAVRTMGLEMATKTRLVVRNSTMALKTTVATINRSGDLASLFRLTISLFSRLAC